VRACIRADTTFGYSNLKLNASSIGPCDTFVATVDVTNTGQVLSDEVVQLYVQSAAAGSVPSPRVRLADLSGCGSLHLVQRRLSTSRSLRSI
jgi:predicted methyltransferase MtxX (methanogen marker protein 4)